MYRVIDKSPQQSNDFNGTIAEMTNDQQSQLLSRENLGDENSSKVLRMS